MLRWDTLLVAATLLGGSMMIENSHRLDTGAPDEALAAAPTSACTDAQARAGLTGNHDSEDGFAMSSIDDDAAQALAPNSCASD
jgi:hypothetical protein